MALKHKKFGACDGRMNSNTHIVIAMLESVT